MPTTSRRADTDLKTLQDVMLLPGATSRQIKDIYHHDRALSDVRNAIRRLQLWGLVETVRYRPRMAPRVANMNFVSSSGLDELRSAGLVDEDGPGAALMMTSRDWQRHILAHPEVVAITYDVAAGMAGVRDERLLVFLPRGSAFDGLVFTADTQRGPSVGIIRAGPLLGVGGFMARITRIARGLGQLEYHIGGKRSTRGPFFVLVTVQTEIERMELTGLFRMGGLLYGCGVRCAFATETEAARGEWKYDLQDPPFVATPTWLGRSEGNPDTDWSPRVPDLPKRNLPPLPTRQLRRPLTPVEDRALDALYRWPLIRPTELAPVIGTGYGARLNHYLQGFRERGLVIDLNALVDRHWEDWREPDLHVALDAIDALEGEYRNKPLLLSDKGLRLLAGRDRAPAHRILYRWGEARPHRRTGEIGIGGYLLKALRDLSHTLGQNAAVSRICADLDYTPDALPDHLSRRYYKGKWRTWRRGEEYEYRQPTSVAPDAAIVLTGHKPDVGRQVRTVLLEYERQASRGGEALTHKLEVWIKYALNGRRMYPGHELIAFVVPTPASRDLLAARWHNLVSSTSRFRFDRQDPDLVVITEDDLHAAGNATSDPIWTYANPKHAPTVALNIGLWRDHRH